MSTAVLKGNAGGTGVVTLETPNTNTNRNIILPDNNGTLVSTATNGLVRITSGTLSSASAITVDSVFSSSYKNYVIYINAALSTGTNNVDFYLQYRATGTTTTANYVYNVNYINAGVNAGTAASSTGASALTIYDDMDNGSPFLGWIQVLNPYESTHTYAQWFLHGSDDGNRKQMLGFGPQTSQTLYDGFYMSWSAGTLSGTYDVYGYAR